jgi:hypothetical protein
MIGYANAGYARLGKGRRVQNEQRAHDLAMAELRSRKRAEELAMLLTSGADCSEEAIAAMAVDVRSPQP